MCRNAKGLFDAAKRAGVARIVHISITNPDRNSDLPYFSGKAEMEEHLKSTGLSHCILRPTVLFGKEDILINNIRLGLEISACLRHFRRRSLPAAADPRGRFG